MARTIDDSKIERIRTVTIEMVVERGFGGASISEIAKKAGVAEGYLYRYYKGKAELVNDLLFTTLNDLINNLEKFLDDLHSVTDIFEQLVRLLFSMARKDPEKVKFLFVLMHDYNFTIQEAQRSRIMELCKKIKVKGHASKELSPEIDEEEVFLMGFTYPIEFVNLRFRKTFKRAALGEKEIKKVLKICSGALKN